MYICKYVYIYIFICKYVHIYICIYVCIYSQTKKEKKSACRLHAVGTDKSNDLDHFAE